MGRLILLLLLPGALFSQGLYKQPSEIIDPAQVDDLEKSALGLNPDCEAILTRANNLLSSYYSQFIADKRIQDERRNPSFAAETLSENTVRLIALARSKEPGREYFLGAQPYLYRLHRLKGVCYHKTEEHTKALNEYAMAFRYTALDPAYQDNPDKNELSAIYLRMAQNFGDKERARQEQDPALRSDSTGLRDLVDRFIQTSGALEAAEKQISVEEARVVRGKGGNPAAARAKRDSLKQQVDSLRSQVEGVRKGSYRTFALRCQKENGELAFTMANIVQELEQKNQEVERILNRSSFYRGIGNELGEDRTSYSGFTGYGILLEFANKIDPSNLLYISKLADEHRKNRRRDLAIRFYEDYFAKASALAQKPADFADNLLKLAGVFTDSQNYIRAADMLEQYDALVSSPAAKLQLADIHYYRTGRTARAKELYDAYMAARPATAGTLKDRVESGLVAFRVQKNLASIARRNLRTGEEMGALAAAENVFRSLEKEEADARKVEEDLRAKLFEIKRRLLGREDEDLQREYYRLQRIELAQAMEQTGYVHTRVDSMNIGQVLERQAYLAERQRNFDLAREKYRELVVRGTGPEQSRARENLERLRLSLADGLLRPPSLSPDFER
ncbi:MAG TPA: hypothetical protein PKE49_13300 [Leptospiraceae bacterium]|nr:hypothetical protein [Leptospirales bacterium]HMU84754.1 hypothetical protein [Leptospiraceae bacterium]HMX57496.1 hypothetical protein [Leptospiraceae bacterium]HNE22759.1 hypothetical protein [Leptospiraceae bacterium]HNJ34045.1 hypothetical protein [Leptospiraceae bacterium]